MKAVLTISKKFFSGHPYAGDATNFATKFLEGSKIHTCRENFEYWEKQIAKLRANEGFLSLRQWSGKSYCSKQEIVKDIPGAECGVQKLTLRFEYEFTELRNVLAYVDGRLIDLFSLAQNDGLSRNEYINWFRPAFDKLMKKSTSPNPVFEKEYALIHFTNFRY